MVRFALNRYFKRESARINVDPTAYNFLKNGVSFLILVIAILNIIYAIPSFRQLAVTRKRWHAKAPSRKEKGFKPVNFNAEKRTQRPFIIGRREASRLY